MAGPFPFTHARLGLTRFPPNVEQISVHDDGFVLWLTVRRNDVILKFPMHPADRRHLAALLLDGIKEA